MMNLRPPSPDYTPKHKGEPGLAGREFRVFAGCSGAHCTYSPKGSAWLNRFHTSHRHASPIYNRWLQSHDNRGSI
jgi:hypothetical protein